MNKQDMAKMLTFLADIYPQFEFPKDSERGTRRFIRSWLKYLGEYEMAEVTKALNELTMESEENRHWPPTAPELAHKTGVNRRERLPDQEWLEEQEKIAMRNLRESREQFGEDSVDFLRPQEVLGGGDD